MRSVPAGDQGRGRRDFRTCAPVRQSGGGTRGCSRIPAKMFDMLAYQDTADPPAKARPRNNVLIRLCPIDACQAHSFRTCVYNRRFRERLEQWSRIAPKLYLWHYCINFSHFLAPFPNYDELISDIPLFQRAGISGLFIEGAVSGGSDDAELRSYLSARLLWKPDLDAVREIREFLNAVYGAAAPILSDYFALRQQEVRRGQHLWVDQNLDARYLTPDFLKHGRALLERASSKVSTEEAHKRVERHLLSLDYVEALREKRCVVRGDSYSPVDPGRVQEKTRKFLKTAEALGITSLREDYPLAKQAQDWGDVAEHYRAIVLTDGPVKAAVVPELGRVVSLGWTDVSGSNILRVPDPGEWAYPHKGGVYVSVSDGPSTSFQLVDWKLTSATRESVTLTGNSTLGQPLRLQIWIAGSILRTRIAISNTDDAPTRVALLCRAEFECGVSREAMLTYMDRSGNPRSQTLSLTDGNTDGNAHFAGASLPQQEWSIACERPALRVRNRFEAAQVERCTFDWSFRDAAWRVSL